MLDPFYGSFFHGHVTPRDVESARDAARRGDASLTAEVQTLSQQVQRLQLVTRALCELLSENSSVPTEAIVDRIQEIDLRDGKLDGKYVEGVIHCSACKRPGRLSRGNCLYCGEALEGDSELDAVL